MTGTVARWNKERGFGFITPDGGQKDVFVHHSEVMSDRARKDLNEGDRVSFETVAAEKGPRAIKVRVS